MLVLADDLLPVRQTIASGRAAERITGRALTGLSATLSFRVGTGLFRPLPARFHSRAEGYFAFGLIPARDLPDVGGAPSVTLRADFERTGGAPAAVEATVPGAALALEEIERDLGGRTVRIERIAGAPFDLSLSVDPAPVALAGIVLRDHDPAAPAVGVTVIAATEFAVIAAVRTDTPLNPTLLLTGALTDDYVAGDTVTLQTATPTAGTLRAGLAAGEQQLPLDTEAGIAAGDVLWLRDAAGDAALDEFLTVAEVSPPAGPNPARIVLAAPLARSHAPDSTLQILTDGATSVALVLPASAGADPAVLAVLDVAGFTAGGVVRVTAGTATAVTDAGGRFFLAALPLVAEVTLRLNEGATTTTYPFHIDYETPVNRVSLSLPS